MIRILTAGVVVALAILLLGALPIESGPLAIVGILAPYLALAALATIPFTISKRARWLRVGLVALVAVFALRFGGEWWSFPPSGVGVNGTPAPQLRVATWNVEAGIAAGPNVVARLQAQDADLVVIEELIPEVAEAIESAPLLAARFPYRAMFPTNGVTGIGLLSAFPISDTTHGLSPVRLETRVAAPGREIAVVGAHPFPARIGSALGWPVRFDPSQRNADLALLRARVDELAATGTDVLLLGDFNTAPTEPAFPRLTGGLHDAHAEAGIGPGWTWRPQRFAFLGTGLLRIDLILSSSALVPLGTSIDCATASDHCLLEATLERR